LSLGHLSNLEVGISVLKQEGSESAREALEVIYY